MLPCGIAMPLITAVNSAFCTIFHLTANNFVGSPFSVVCCNEKNKTLICQYARNKGGSGVSAPISIVCSSEGTARTFKARLQIFYSPEGKMKWVVSCFDAMVEKSGEHFTVVTFPRPESTDMNGEQADENNNLNSCLNENSNIKQGAAPRYEDLIGSALPNTSSKFPLASPASSPHELFASPSASFLLESASFLLDPHSPFPSSTFEDDLLNQAYSQPFFPTAQHSNESEPLPTASTEDGQIEHQDLDTTMPSPSSSWSHNQPLCNSPFSLLQDEDLQLFETIL